MKIQALGKTLRNRGTEAGFRYTSTHAISSIRPHGEGPAGAMVGTVRWRPIGKDGNALTIATDLSWR